MRNIDGAQSVAFLQVDPVTTPQVENGRGKIVMAVALVAGCSFVAYRVWQSIQARPMPGVQRGDSPNLDGFDDAGRPIGQTTRK